MDDPKCREAMAWARALTDAQHTHAEWVALMAQAPRNARTLVDLVTALATKLDASAQVLIEEPVEEPATAIQLDITGVQKLLDLIESEAERRVELRRGLQQPASVPSKSEKVISRSTKL